MPTIYDLYDDDVTPYKYHIQPIFRRVTFGVSLHTMISAKLIPYN